MEDNYWVVLADEYVYYLIDKSNFNYKFFNPEIK